MTDYYGSNNDYSMTTGYPPDDLMENQASVLNKQNMHSSEKPLMNRQPISDMQMPYQGVMDRNQMNNMFQNDRANYNYNLNPMSTDYKSFIKRAIKYLVEGIAVALVAYYFTKGKLDAKEIILLGITAAFVFAILDTVSPTVSMGARLGAGFGIGQTMFGLTPALAAGAAFV